MRADACVLLVFIDDATETDAVTICSYYQAAEGFFSRKYKRWWSLGGTPPSFCIWFDRDLTPIRQKAAILGVVSSSLGCAHSGYETSPQRLFNSSFIENRMVMAQIVALDWCDKTKSNILVSSFIEAVSKHKKEPIYHQPLLLLFVHLKRKYCLRRNCDFSGDKVLCL